MKYSQGLSSACWKLSLLLAKWAATPRFPPLAGPTLPLWMLILSGSITGRGCCDTLVNSLQELRLVECLRRGGYGWTVPLPLLLLLLLSLAGPGGCGCCVLALALLLPDEPRLLQDACLFSIERGKIGVCIVWIVTLFMALENTVHQLDTSVSISPVSAVNMCQQFTTKRMWLTCMTLCLWLPRMGTTNCIFDLWNFWFMNLQEFTTILSFEIWCYMILLIFNPNHHTLCLPQYAYIPGEGEFDLLEAESGSPLPE